MDLNKSPHEQLQSMITWMREYSDGEAPISKERWQGFVVELQDRADFAERYLLRYLEGPKGVSNLVEKTSPREVSTLPFELREHPEPFELMDHPEWEGARKIDTNDDNK